MNEQIKQGNTIESNDGQQIMGFVASTDGATVVVVSADGTLRELNPGDAIREGDVLQVTDGSHVTITFADGSTRQLDSGGTFVIAQDTFQQLALVDGGEEQNPEFEALLAALNEGQDIAEGQEATAAGEAGAAGGSGDEIGQGLYFNLIGGEVTPTAGIDPDYVPPPTLDPTADTDVQEGVPTVSVSVEVEIDIQDPPDGGEPPTTPTPEYPVVVSGNSASVLEGTSEGGKEIVFILQLDKAYNQDVTVTYELKPVTADNPEDWYDGPVVNTVTIPAGETSFPVTVTIVEDRLDEGNETFDIMILSATNATVNPSSNSATVTIFDDDTTPVANDDSGSISDGVEISYVVSGNVLSNDTDEDGDSPQVVANSPIVLGHEYGTLVIEENGSYTFTLNEEGKAYLISLKGGETDSITFEDAYQVTDGVNDGNFADVVITLEGINDPPVAGDDSDTTNEDTPVVIDVTGNDSDVDGTIVGWTLVSQASNGSVVNNGDGTFTYTPNANFFGSDSFTYTVTDDDGAVSNVATVSVTIADVNDPPVAGDDSDTTNEDTPVVIDVTGNDSDVDGTIVGWTLVSQASNGSVVNNGDGTFTYTPNANFFGSDSFTYTVTDDDGAVSNVATVSVTIASVNDRPVAQGGVLRVSEEGLSGGNIDDIGTDDQTNSATDDITIPGSDIDGDTLSYSLSTLASLSSGGQSIAFAGTGTVGDPLIGTIDGGVTTIITLTVDATGKVSVTLDGPIDHESDTDNEGELSFNVTLTVSDGLLSDDATVTVTVEDDSPVVFYPEHAHVVLPIAGGESVEVSQSINFAGKVGGDGLGTVKFDSSLDGIAFTDDAGLQLFLNNKPLTLEIIDDQHIQAVTSDGEIAMQAEIDALGDVTITMFPSGFITNTEITTVTDLSGIGGGNVPFKGLNIGSKQSPDADTTDDVLVSSEINPLNDLNAGSVNSNATELGVGQGNEVSSGEYIRYDLVEGLSIVDSPNNESYSFTNHQEAVYSFKQQVNITGGSKDADFIVRVYNSSGTASGETTSLVNGGTSTPDFVAITAADIVIYDASNVAVGDPSPYVVDNGDGTVTIHELQNGWWFEVNTVDSGAGGFTALEIQGTEYGADNKTTSFKLGQFQFGSDSDVDPVSFDLAVQGEDADGDTIGGTLSVTVYPDTKSIEGDDLVNLLTGEDGVDDYIFGYGGVDTLQGGTGNDTLVGGDGNDYLFGGQGNDTLVGGAGADNFIWGANDTGAVDVIEDFQAGSGGDVLDLQSLLTGENAANLDEYFEFSQDGNGGTIVVIDTDGAGTDTATIHLEHTDLTAGGTLSNAEIIGNLVADGNLVTNT